MNPDFRHPALWWESGKPDSYCEDTEPDEESEYIKRRDTLCWELIRSSR